MQDFWIEKANGYFQAHFNKPMGYEVGKSYAINGFRLRIYSCL